jgi:branched-chain amino acid transport system substrate-binding protein
MHYYLSLARRRAIQGLAAVAAATVLSNPAFAADPLKIGLILPLTGPFASTGKQIEAACRLYIAKNGDTVAGRKVELIVKDDTGLAPETTKRIAQELVVQDKVSVLAGFGLTPLALAAAPVATEAKVPMIVMAAATGMIPTRSPFIVRTGFTLPQVTGPIAEWAAKNKIKRVVTMVTDYGPGLEPRNVRDGPSAGGEVVESIDAIAQPDYAPSCSARRTRRPCSSRTVRRGPGTKQSDERGLKQAGIIGTGARPTLSKARLQWRHVVPLFAAHDSRRTATSKLHEANNGMRLNSTRGLRWMHLIYEAVKKAGATTRGSSLKR